MLQEYFQNQSNDDKQLTRDEFVQLFKVNIIKKMLEFTHKYTVMYLTVFV